LVIRQESIDEAEVDLEQTSICEHSFSQVRKSPQTRRTPSRKRLLIQARTEFREIVTKRLSLTEVRNICHDLDIDHETLTNGGKGDLVRACIKYLENRGRLSDLLEWLKEIRHDVWKDLPLKVFDPLQDESRAPEDDSALPGRKYPTQTSWDITGA
jgi:hypothetical protein